MSFEKRIDNLFQIWQRELCPGGQILVSQYGKTLYRKNFGYANLEFNMPITNKTYFHLASLSKQVTVLALMLLVEEGKLSLEDDVKEHLPEYIHFTEKVSLRQLINNTSGIRDQWQSLNFSGVRINDTISQEDLLGTISRQRHLNFAPNSQYLYSNSNFTLLAEIVAKISGQAFPEFVRKRIFEPLGMNSTLIRSELDQILPLRATSYIDDGQGNFKVATLSYSVYGATSVTSSVDDFHKFVDNYRNPKVGQIDSLKFMENQPQLADGEFSTYGGGLMLNDYKGFRVVEHGGADAGFRAHMLRIPEEDLAILIFSNTQNMVLSLIARRIANIVLNLVEDKPALLEIKEQSEQRARYGLFASEDYLNIVKIQFDKEKNAFKKDETILRHLEHNRYRLGYTATEYYFSKDGFTEVIGPNTKDYKFIADKPLPPGDAYAYCGKYYSEEIAGTYEIVCRNNFLYFKHFRHGEHRIYQSENSNTLFFSQNKRLNALFTFGQEAQGKFNKLTLSGGRIKGIELNRI
ncbi:MAG: beta-lactamase family protein [Firmicutes bacterium]|jgi:CubicO group peptidase (beta-lactamase class C family)|nr:beta-lactamase family protein [Bacillota bacterium]